MKKIYDCTVGYLHRPDSMGPKQNDIMRGLHTHAEFFGFQFVTNPTEADVIITNNIFPDEILLMGKPLVKRMDGVYYLNREKDRNIPLNKAAIQADCVIFISEYSRRSFENLYHLPLRHSVVILNRVDDRKFFHLPDCRQRKFTWVASATNWEREEKRYNDLVLFAKNIMGADEHLIIIGKCDSEEIPKVKKVGHLDSEIEMNRILNLGDAFINLSYRDAAPKVVCQAQNCHLPVLFANSGGTAELVDLGIPIEEKDLLIFENSVPRLDPSKIRVGHDRMIDLWMSMKNGDLKVHWRSNYPRNGIYNHRETIGRYFSYISSVIR